MVVADQVNSAEARCIIQVEIKEMTSIPENEDESWGYHLNRTEHSAAHPPVPGWANPNQREDWKNRGLVLWDRDIHRITLIRPRYVQNFLGQMKGNPRLRSEGCTLGAPAYAISLEKEERRIRKGAPDSPKEELGEWILSNPMELGPERAQELFDFLQAQEVLVDELALKEQKESDKAIVKALRLFYHRGLELRQAREKPSPE
jgi:hypothetical protein